MKFYIILFFLGLGLNSIAQPEGLSSELAKKMQITEAGAILDMADDSSEYEGLQIYYFDFDEEGRCPHEKFIAPFFDVVSTSDEDFYTYNNQGEVIERIVVRGTEELSKRDKNFISLFGKDSDTTFYRNEYDANNRLLKSTEIGGFENDTLISDYLYSKGLLTKMIHYSRKYKGQLNSENYTEEYQYDKRGRLTQIQHHPETLTSSSTTIIKYKDKKSDLKLEEKTTMDFRWRWIIQDGKRTVEVSQDSLNGKMVKYEYDKNDNLIKYTTFYSLDDLESDFSGRTYKYEGKQLVEEQSFNESERIINLTDKIEYHYNAEGLLEEQRMIYRGEWRFSYVYTYE